MTNPTGDPVSTLREMAHPHIAEMLVPGAGFTIAPAEGFEQITGYRPQAVHEHRREWSTDEWKLVGAQQRGSAWTFEYVGPIGIQATGRLTLDGEYRAATYQVTLSNTASTATPPLCDVPSLFFKLAGMRQPTILTCSGASSTAGWPHAREFPPDAFRTRVIAPVPPRPVELTSAPGTGTRRSGSSVKDVPIFLLAEGCDGPGMFIGLEWSTVWAAHTFFTAKNEAMCVKMGVLLRQLILDPGESLELPIAHIGFFDHGFESGTNCLRRYIYDRLSPHYMGKPTLPAMVYTIWPGLAAPFTVDDLKPIADVGGEIGVEMFTVDADWYTGDYHGGLGNWEVDPKKFPQGLKPFSDYLQTRGMGLGLYFEGAAHPGTKLPTEHPEFYYDLGDDFFGIIKYNFSRTDACDYLIDLIAGFAEQYDVRYVRCDFFLDPRERGEPFDWHVIDPKGKAAFRHMQGLNRVWDELRRRCPKLMLEVNNGGGNSLDLATMRRTYAGWLNDNTGGPHLTRMLQFGANHFMPANYLGMAVGPNADGTGQGDDDDFKDVAFLGRMAGEFLLHGRLNRWPQEVQRRARHWVTVYKKIRHLLVKDFYRLLPQPQSQLDWDAAQFSNGPQEGIIFAFRYAGHEQRRRIHLRDVDARGDYRIVNESSGQTQAVLGEQLVTDGLDVELMQNDAKLFSYRCV